MTDTNETDQYFDLGDELSGQGAQALQAGNTEEGCEFFRQAIDAYTAALRSAPPDDLLLTGNLRLCIGARWAGMGERDKALAAFEEVLAELEGRPDLTTEGEGAEILAQARLNRAECRLTAGAVEEAKVEIQAVLTAFPEHPYAEYLLSRCEQST